MHTNEITMPLSWGLDLDSPTFTSTRDYTCANDAVENCQDASMRSPSLDLDKQERIQSSASQTPPDQPPTTASIPANLAPGSGIFPVPTRFNKVTISNEMLSILSTPDTALNDDVVDFYGAYLVDTCLDEAERALVHLEPACWSQRPSFTLPKKAVAWVILPCCVSYHWTVGFLDTTRSCLYWVNSIRSNTQVPLPSPLSDLCGKLNASSILVDSPNQGSCATSCGFYVLRAIDVFLSHLPRPVLGGDFPTMSSSNPFNHHKLRRQCLSVVESIVDRQPWRVPEARQPGETGTPLHNTLESLREQFDAFTALAKDAADAQAATRRIRDDGLRQATSKEVKLAGEVERSGRDILAEQRRTADTADYTSMLVSMQSHADAVRGLRTERQLGARLNEGDRLARAVLIGLQHSLHMAAAAYDGLAQEGTVADPDSLQHIQPPAHPVRGTPSAPPPVETPGKRKAVEAEADPGSSVRGEENSASFSQQEMVKKPKLQGHDGGRAKG